MSDWPRPTRHGALGQAHPPPGLQTREGLPPIGALGQAWFGSPRRKAGSRGTKNRATRARAIAGAAVGHAQSPWPSGLAAKVAARAGWASIAAAWPANLSQSMSPGSKLALQPSPTREPRERGRSRPTTTRSASAQFSNCDSFFSALSFGLPVIVLVSGGGIALGFPLGLGLLFAL